MGPPAAAIDAMGDKVESKRIAEAAGVSVIPGFNGVVESAEHAVAVAEDIGYPARHGVREGAFDAKSEPEAARIVGKGCRTSGLDCLNYLVADALELVPDSLAYLGASAWPGTERRDWFSAFQRNRSQLKM